MAHDNATDRVNSALATLRNELSEMRNQDVQLMKQLLNINNSIQQLSKRQKHSKRVKIINRGKRPLLSEMFTVPTLTKIDEGNIIFVYEIVTFFTLSIVIFINKKLQNLYSSLSFHHIFQYECKVKGIKK